MTPTLVSRICSALAAVVLASGTYAQDPAPAERPLTLEEAVSLASGDQPAVAAFQREAVASEQAAVAARSLPDPQISVGIQNFPITGDNALSPTDDFMTMYTIGVMREQVRRSRREAQSARLLAEAGVSRAEGSVQEARFARDVMIAWINAVEAAATQRLLTQIVSDLRVGRRVMEAAIPTGGSNVALALAAQAEIALAQAQLTAARGAEGRARGVLARWIGAAANRPLPDQVPTITLAADENTAVRSHPEVRAGLAQELAAQRQVDVARSERRPNLSWSVALGLRPEFGHMISAQVSIPLQINRRGLQNRRIAEAQARADAARLRTLDAVREIEGAYATALADYRSAAATIDELRDEAIPSLEASFEAAEARYAGGQGTLELPLDIVRRYVEANVELVEQEASLARAAAELIYLTGETPR